MGSQFWEKLKIKLKKATGRNVFLCDSCKWDWRSTCHNPDRPNATRCPDYQRKGT